MGRTLAERVFATHDQPPFPRSPLDGYAVIGEDTDGAAAESPVTLKVIAEVDAGDVFADTLQPGEAVRIMTGAPVPNGANAVIRQENTDYGEDQVRLYRSVRPWQNYVFQGEDYKEGHLLVRPGACLDASTIAVLASLGLESVTVVQRPRALVISTGSELQHPGEPLKPGRIYDSNLFMLQAQLKDWGVDVAEAICCQDDPALVEDYIRSRQEEVDLIFTTGGVSVGKRDIMHEVFRDLKVEKMIGGLAIKPGSAVLCGKYRGKWLLALSGNPYASFVGLQLLARPILCGLTGNDALKMVYVNAALADSYDKASPLRRFVRAYLQEGLVYLEGHTGGNGDVASGLHINALLDIPAGTKAMEAGSRASVWLL